MKRMLLFLLLCAALVSTAHAYPIIGETVRIEWHFPAYGTIYATTDAVVVDPGAEWTPGAGLGPIDIGDGWITLQNLTYGWTDPGAGGFNGIVIHDLNGTIPDFTSFQLVSIAGFAPPIDPVLSYDADHLTVNFHPAGGTGDNVGGGMGQLYTFAFEMATDVVPEPGSFALLAFGVAALAGFSLRRRR